MASDDFKTAEAKLKQNLVSLTRSANLLANEDLSFQRSAHPEVANRLDDASERLVGLASGLLKSATQSSTLRTPRLDETDDIDLRWRGIVDVIDHLLEKADTTLDEYTGLIKRQGAVFHDARPQYQPALRSSVLSDDLRNANITKPQLLFEQKPDNYAATWRPILTSKPHAKVPLEQSIELFRPEEKADAPRYEVSDLPGSAEQNSSGGGSPTASPGMTPGPDSSETKRRRRRQRSRAPSWKRHTPIPYANSAPRYRNPYEREIRDAKYPDSVYKVKEPTPYLPPETTAAIWIDTFDGVLAMLDELKQATEIAIDLEHHDLRSYIGLTSLMQVSTRTKDWIVDTLKPWRHRLEVLNEVFSDPKIVKVLHGSYMDIIWLQRDLGIYVVGLFDTGAASEVLKYPSRSLAYLLKRFINFDADKKYQRADWRIRPLPEEMFYYARSDTHYLLYIFDRLRNELVETSDFSNPENDRIEEVMRKSKEFASQSYEGIAYGEDGKGPMGWYRPLSKKNVPRCTDTQFAIYRAVHKWRDDLARKEDDSPTYIMPAHAVYEISYQRPTDLRALVSLLGRNSHGANPKRLELFSIVQQAASDPNPMSYRATFFGNFATDSPLRPPGDRGISKQEPVVAYVQRSSRSQMFGDVPVSSRWESNPQVTANSMENVRFPVPWAKFVTGFTTEETLTARPPNEVAEAAQLDPSPPAKGTAGSEAPAATLNASKKRKATDLAEEPGTNGECEPDTSSTSESESEPDSDARVPTGAQPGPKIILGAGSEADEPEKASKTRNKGKKKRNQGKKGEDAAGAGADVPKIGGGVTTPPAKKGRKQKKKDKKDKKKKGANDSKSELNVEEEEPFDYSKARSMIHRQDKNGSGKDKEKKKPKGNLFNKDLQGDIKPARKTNYERSGKSKTFSS